MFVRKQVVPKFQFPPLDRSGCSVCFSLSFFTSTFVSLKLYLQPLSNLPLAHFTYATPTSNVHRSICKWAATAAAAAAATEVAVARNDNNTNNISVCSWRSSHWSSGIIQFHLVIIKLLILLPPLLLPDVIWCQIVRHQFGFYPATKKHANKHIHKLKLHPSDGLIWAANKLNGRDLNRWRWRACQ